jgi:predicted RNase H-like nuclease (RuvC/YqgF family)
MSYTINGGVGQSDYGDIKWRLNQLVDDMNIMWTKISQLEQSQPVGIRDLEWRVDLQDDTMNEVLKRVDELETIRDENSERYEAMESFKDAGEPVNQHYIDCLKQNVRLIEENDVLRYQYETMREETARCKAQLDQFEKIVADKQKVLTGEINIEESSTYWQQRYNEQLQTTDILYKELANKQKVLEMTMDQRDAAQWYREQAIKKCVDIVEQIKNDPLTVGDGKRWMVAICEDIQRAIKNEFGVK